MKIFNNVYGSEEQAVPLIVCSDTVYVHTNIKKTDVNESGEPALSLYTYDEIQYTKDEYIFLLSEKNSDLEGQLTDTQLALCELYELVSQ